jgi:hypothetical protein
MKATILPVALTILSFVSFSRGLADPSVTYTGINDMSEIGLPLDQYTVIKAVNVGGNTADTVNGITFAADPTAPATTQSFDGNGYSAVGNTEESSGIEGVSFTQTTVNIGGTGFLQGDTFASLSSNEDYVFDLYLSDDNAGRGFVFSYKIGDTDWVTTGSYYQTEGPVNLLRLSFNTGLNTSFDWKIESSETNHDSKTSGFALYSTVPEPTSIALFFAGVGLLLLFRRRRRRVS